MKSTGIVRNLDALGRIVIPMELRRTLGIADGDALEIFVNGDQIVLRKYAPGCALCGNAENIAGFAKGKLICGDCVEVIVAISKLDAARWSV